ncbi:DNA recombination protein RmuC [Rickettsiales endosymbiont of Trichoplax sp. H2]|uniref:DNA recombination protein RmuC n=1 Tax=Rickettsiales endosymbiont of Trichoplax sp. H2 TaxID=2021221 RepID=UPI0012B39E1A|nr:DNA recombination protein RmuC [Rickettsiales endosymbiont of Trichoplax sp. H2]MSO13598.1 DNA recombination protein RmuC-like [Rickettsiales endosymbiont of Trichoplax sp. H2]
MNIQIILLLIILLLLIALSIYLCIICIKNSNNIDALKDTLSEQKSSINLLNNFFDKQINFLHSSITKQIENNYLNQQKQLDSMQKQLVQIAELNENKIENMRRSMEEKVNNMQQNNQKKLDEIRAAVEEKLQSTLEKRLGESFKLVSNQLEMVYKGLGEMQNLATGVGDLKKVLTNVKTKGIWGEVQLGNILKQVLSEEQYEENAKIDPLSNQRVEYALKLPNKDEEDSNTLLPIDAKLPMIEYHKLIEFYEDGDKSNIEKQVKILEIAVKKEAKSINEKYIKPPHSTDFAVMFLPVEGLYAEIVRIPGLLDKLQRDYRVIITSPTTLIALLNSIQMGFKTLAIEKRSNEVWKLLDTVKHEFSNFIGILSKTKVKLDQASKAIGDAEYKGNVIKNKLQNVEKLPLSK